MTLGYSCNKISAMFAVSILAPGRIKGHALESAFANYAKRLKWSLEVVEIDGKNTEDEHKKILEKIDPKAVLIALDEKGKTLSSREFASRIETFQNQGYSKAQFILGGADGLSDDIRQKAALLMSFGKQTWPHILCRVMLLEQIYRAEQILAGHPYHRD